ncbi:MAG: nucleotidyltransferase domain-containing protein [Truepera sp.]|nr:nucleotidyltransferase domain-containing protein [Truepera sp.]
MSTQPTLSPQLRQLLRALREALESRYGTELQDLILFGSEVRGEAREDSDIDIVLVLRRQVQPGAEIARLGDILADLNLRYGRLVSVIPTSQTHYQQAPGPFWRNVRAEGIRL